VNVIEAIKYLLLGLVQGVTEVLPVSSSGHVELAKALFNLDIDEGLLFLILVNTGSLIAVFIVFFKDIVKLLVEFFQFLFVSDKRETTRTSFDTVLKIGLASIPAGIIGIIFSDAIEAVLKEYNVLVSGVGLLFTGTLLLLASQRKIKNGSTRITYLDAILIGAAQAVALVPGISRSGSTTTTALKRGIGIDSAVKFSFFMYIPVSIGSLLLSVVDVAQTGVEIPNASYLFYYFLAFVGAIVASWIAFKVIFNIFKSGRLILFSVYCFAVGFISIALFIIKS
jgi:undecaprenyl-diphosphatase